MSIVNAGWGFSYNNIGKVTKQLEVRGGVVEGKKKKEIKSILSVKHKQQQERG